ncbi:WD40-repeat-containing domain protein [Aspergillus stella-maris]|uniref:WD40-repeat-containing domain protein n=1 Tax=Aspergillus stella-maris TaxID=1810926 RepID=UPI003CCE460F
MSDPISIMTSVVALVEMSEYIVKTCEHYITRVKKARQEITRLLQEVKSLSGVLKSLKELVEGPNGEKLSITRTLLSDLESCSSVLKGIDAKIRPDETKNPMRRWGWRALKWPLKSQEVEKSVNDLEKFKTTFSLALEADKLTYTIAIDQKITLGQLQVAKGATFDAYENKHDECFRGTRVELLEKLESWAKSPGGKPIFWVNGRAGTGKSTISRTIASRLKGAKMLGASFFFKRGEEGLQNAQKLFPTLVQQLVDKIPQLVPGVQKAIEEDSSIGDKALREQFEKLLLHPLQETKKNSTDILVVVIDALDECEREEDIRLLLRLLPQLQSVTAVRLKFLLTGRPELFIRLGFMEVGDGYQDLILHDIAEEVIERDISLFLEDRLCQIRKEWEFRRVVLSSDWPGEQNTTALVKMSVPLFIFAATICRLLQDDQWHPEDSLKDILSQQSHGSQLDQTYLPVLNRLPVTQNNKKAKQLTDEYRRLLGTIIVLQAPLSAGTLSKLTGVPRTSLHQRLNSLHSVLSVPEDEKEPVRLFHLSFRDFLVDEDTRGKTPLWIDEAEANRHLATHCFDVMRHGLRKNICQLPSYGTSRTEIDQKTIKDYLTPELQYSCRYWATHYTQCGIFGGDSIEVFGFLKEHLLHWIEAMSILGAASAALQITADVQSFLLVSSPDHYTEVSEFLHDAERFMLRNRSILDDAPLQVYASALAFAPKGSIMRTIFENDIPSWINGLPEVEDDWGALIQTIQGHSSSVGSVAFSPDGQLLASGAHDGTVKLWNPVTGELQQTLTGHDGPATVALSAQFLVSSSCGSLRISDPFTGELLHTLDSHVTRKERNLAFSPDGLLAFDAPVNIIQIWNPKTGQLMQTLAGHDGELTGLDFSSELLISSYRDNTIWLWDTATWELRFRFKGHSGEVRRSALSATGSLATGAPDGTIKLWNPRTGELQQTLYPNASTGSIVSIAFAPDGLILASIAMDAIIRIWDSSSGLLQNTLYGGDGQFIPSIAFSPTDQVIASASLDCNIMLWSPSIEGPQPQLMDRDSVFAMTFSEDCQLLAAGLSNGIVQLWDPLSGSLRWTSPRHPESETTLSIAFSPDNQFLASSSGDMTITIWSTITGAQQRKLLGHTDRIGCIKFSPNGKLLASGSMDRTVRLWDFDADEQYDNLVITEEHDVDCIAFSSDSRYVASGAHSLHIWDVTSKNLEQTLKGHDDGIAAVVFAPQSDCQLLATGSQSEIKLWNSSSGQLLHTFSVSEGDSLGLAFSSIGPFISTARLRLCIEEWYKHDTSVIADNDYYDVGAFFSRNPEDLLGRHDRWVCLQSKKLLYLPVKYQYFCFAVARNRIAIGFNSEVLFLSAP